MRSRWWLIYCAPLRGRYVPQQDFPRRAFTLAPSHLQLASFTSICLTFSRGCEAACIPRPWTSVVHALIALAPLHRISTATCTRSVASLRAPSWKPAHFDTRGRPHATAPHPSNEPASGEQLDPNVVMEDDECATSRMGGIKLEDGAPNGVHPESGSNSVVPKSEPREDDVQSPALSHDGPKSRSDSVETSNSQKPPKLSRKTSQKNDQPPREPVLYGDLPDVTEDSCKAFQVIPDCLYGSKHLGSTDNDAFDCDCREEWRK